MKVEFYYRANIIHPHVWVCLNIRQVLLIENRFYFESIDGKTYPYELVRMSHLRIYE